MSKPKTQAQLDKATDQRLRKTYGVGLDWYEEQLRLQNGGCAICRRPPGTRRLHIDHDHSWKKVKVSPKWVKGDEEVAGYWIASALYTGKDYERVYVTKREAVRRVKVQLKKASVRGLLCHLCNRSLVLLNDRPDLFQRAAEYLEKHQGVKT